MTEETSVSRRTRRTFTAEQKAEAVHLAKTTGNISQVARDLDITRSSLVQWIERAKIDEGQILATRLRFTRHPRVWSWPDPILRTLGKERFARVLIRENPDLLNKLRSPLNNREPLRVGA
jgi:transposase-like protein